MGQENTKTAPTKMVAGADFTSISITSDGTMKGTMIMVNGQQVDPESFNFSFYKSEYSGTNIDISWSEEDKSAQPGQLSSRRYFRLVPASILKKAIACILPCSAKEVDTKVLPRGVNKYVEIGNKPGQTR